MWSRLVAMRKSCSEETIRLDASEIKILSLDALIRIKEHIQRPKDHESLMHLQAIKQMRDKLR